MARRKANADAGGDHPQNRRRPSITAVARHAQVSIATVSRVVNDAETVHPDLRRRVQAAIEAIGYVPDVSARSLSSGRSRLFGVIISNLNNPFFPELLQSFEERAVALGYEVLVVSTAYDPQRMSVCIDRMLKRKVDGVAVMTFGMEGPLLSRFADRGVPLVFMDRAPDAPDMFAITVDYDAGIQQAVQHLAVLGHRRIAFVAGPEQYESVAKRRRAVERALNAIGLPQPPDFTFSGDHSLTSGEHALQHFLALPQPPTAVLCSNDVSAIGVMHAAMQAGISIPDQLSLIGFDGVEIGAYMVPPLTSISMSRSQIAERAVDILWSRVEAKAVPADLTVQTQLLVRRTTTIPHGSLSDLRPPAKA